MNAEAYSALSLASAARSLLVGIMVSSTALSGCSTSSPVREVGSQSAADTPDLASEGATHELSTSATAGLHAANSKCQVAQTSTYGFTPDDPVKVGGSDNDGVDRQFSYLKVLRGPTGQGLHFRRLGSVLAGKPGQRINIDVYEISYEGLEKPLHVYLDLYRYEEPMAPQGFTCVKAIPFRAP